MSEWTSNTTGCLRGLIGHRVVGITTNRHGDRMLVLDDGTGFAFNGAFWRERTEEVTLSVEARLRELRETEADIRDALRAAGVET